MKYYLTFVFLVSVIGTASCINNEPVRASNGNGFTCEIVANDYGLIRCSNSHNSEVCFRFSNSLSCFKR